ncbi:hypothetical protein Taro_056047 [Colocasia esculenta]|uniref:Uncharacterized protein n=1 Tax=Colocasia esculenta TaxID=4460 RepID=A0A843XUN0_COLES|nr:hypothetical protein [Colocasia esculenta]
MFVGVDLKKCEGVDPKRLQFFGVDPKVLRESTPVGLR